MSKFAIIGIGGKQHRVTEGAKIVTEKVATEVGKTLKLQHVFLVGDDKEAKIGDPLVAGATVEAKVIETGKGEKIRVFKMKRRKRYRVDRGHRQPFSELEIVKING
jgi:large subunit ribosomal protein L21